MRILIAYIMRQPGLYQEPYRLGSSAQAHPASPGGVHSSHSTQYHLE